MTALLFADSNILIYAMDRADPVRRAKAASILDACSRQRTLVTSPQSLNECYRVLIEKRRIVPKAVARSFIQSFAWSCVAPLDWPTIEKAWAISDVRSYHWWDCLLLASAVRAGCAVFVTEDMQSGDEIDGMVLVNPFTTDLSAFF